MKSDNKEMVFSSVPLPDNITCAVGNNKIADIIIANIVHKSNGYPFCKIFLNLKPFSLLITSEIV